MRLKKTGLIGEMKKVIAVILSIIHPTSEGVENDIQRDASIFMLPVVLYYVASALFRDYLPNLDGWIIVMLLALSAVTAFIKYTIFHSIGPKVKTWLDRLKKSVSGNFVANKLGEETPWLVVAIAALIILNDRMGLLHPVSIAIVAATGIRVTQLSVDVYRGWIGDFGAEASELKQMVPALVARMYDGGKGPSDPGEPPKELKTEKQTSSEDTTDAGIWQLT